VLIRTFTTAPEDVGAYGPLSDARGERTFHLDNVRATSKGVVARVRGVSSRNAAEVLKGVELYTARARFPATNERQYYHADLIGLAAVDPHGNRIGEIVAVQNFGAGDLLEIRLAGTSKTEFAPFTDEVVPELDLAIGRAVVVLPRSDDRERKS
jgi:16S rRNA processing protein RimM